MKNVVIRKASVDDLQALIDVGDQLFDYPIKPERAKEFFADPRHHLFIALINEKIIGFASGLDYVHPDKDTSFFINEIAVLDEFQNQGIGREITKAIAEYARSFQSQETWLATEVKNKSARKAYINAGGVEDPDKIVMYTFD